MKGIRLSMLLALAAASLQAQPPNGAVYWSTEATPPDCSSLAGESAVAITDAGGATLGYSCYVSGTFVWLAAGGGWGTSIRAAAPASAAVGVDYTFYAVNGDALTLDTNEGDGPTASGQEVSFALAPNQPAELGLLGATNNAPAYGATATGSVYAIFYCPDAMTCSHVTPQLLYSSTPSKAWGMGVPLTWDTALWTQWSAQGVDDGGAQRVSVAINNVDMAAASFTIQVYDSKGKLAGSGVTPSIPGLRQLENNVMGQGGTWGALLSDIVTPLPAGLFKVMVDGGSSYSAVEVLQFSGPVATALQISYDSAATVTQPQQTFRRRRRPVPRMPAFHLFGGFDYK